MSRRADARGLEVSLGGLGQDQLVEREIGDGFTHPTVLKLQLFEPLHLVGFEPAELLATRRRRPLRAGTMLLANCYTWRRPFGRQCL